MSTTMENQKLNEENTLPPPPPPAPPLPPLHENSSEKASIALKVRDAPHGWAFEGQTTGSFWDYITPLAGTYFFYGSLQDPDVLSDVLGLKSPPALRPARIVGYKVRLWGQYPALSSEPDGHLQGLAFEVPDEASASRLAKYETNSYRPKSCIIEIEDTDGNGQTTKVNGYVFEFCGNPNDLSDGTFDLERWRHLNGRKYGNA
jgi:hypothetical protein